MMIPFFSGRRNRVQLLSPEFSTYLDTKYGLSQESTTGWRYIEGSTTVASRKVKLFRIFDPAAVPAGAKISYDALDEVSKAVQFEGRLAKDGSISQFKDAREPAS